MADPTRSRMKSQGKTHEFYSTHEKKKVKAPIDSIDERKKGGWIAHGKDSQGRPLTSFVARGTKKD